MMDIILMERKQIICPYVYGTNAIIQLIQEYTFICAPFINKEVGNTMWRNWVFLPLF